MVVWPDLKAAIFLSKQPSVTLSHVHAFDRNEHISHFQRARILPAASKSMAFKKPTLTRRHYNDIPSPRAQFRKVVGNRLDAHGDFLST
jgi:hypothetical protein